MKGSLLDIVGGYALIVFLWYHGGEMAAAILAFLTK